MSGERRRRLAEEALEGYAHGPDAPLEATAEALEKAASARAVVLVEGISDQIAVETLAARVGRDLPQEGIVVVPIGGAQAIGRHLVRFGPHGADVAITGLCDAAEEGDFRQGLRTAGIGSPGDRRELEQLGFFVCVADLEGELIRAFDPASTESLLDTQGDLGSFRTLQKQPAWREAGFEPQMHRWLRAGARRNLRYARLMVLSIPIDDMPRPLTSVLAATPY